MRALFEPPRPPTAAAVQSAAGTLQCLACDGEGRATLHSAGTGRDEGGTREVATSSKNSRTAPAGGWRGPRAAHHFFVTHAGSAKRRANQATRPPESTVRSTGLVLLLLTARPGTASEQGRGAAEGYSSSECGISALPESSRRSGGGGAVRWQLPPMCAACNSRVFPAPHKLTRLHTWHQML